jgi:hypothetical protein
MRDLVIHVPNEPGALAKVAAAVSDAGVNLAAATHIGSEPTADLHILVKHPEATRRVLEPAGITVGEDREVVVVEAQDHPGVLADLARRVADAGVNLDLVYVATGTRIVFGSDDMPALRAALGVHDEEPAFAGTASPAEVDVEAGSLL